MSDPYRPCTVNMKQGWICTRGYHADGPCALVPHAVANYDRALNAMAIPPDHICSRDDINVDKRAYHSLVRRWRAIVELCRSRQEPVVRPDGEVTVTSRLTDVDAIWPSEIMEIVMRGIDE